MLSPLENFSVFLQFHPEMLQKFEKTLEMFLLLLYYIKVYLFILIIHENAEGINREGTVSHESFSYQRGQLLAEISAD
jgi:hypothetical protein